MNKKYAALFTASALLLTERNSLSRAGCRRNTPSNRHTCQCAGKNACTFHGG